MDESLIRALKVIERDSKEKDALIASFKEKFDEKMRETESLRN